MKEVILYFGSYNPVHNGHIGIADVALDQIPADGLWFVVSPQSPFKNSSELAPEEDRLKMVEIAMRTARHRKQLKACDAEFHMDRPARTIDTLKVLCAKYPDHRFSLMIGGDNVKGFDKWKNYREILDNYRVVVYPREGSDPVGEDFNGRFHFLKDVPAFAVSSTHIREMIAAGEDCRSYLPRGVWEYIEKHELYAGAKFYLQRGKEFRRNGKFAEAMNDFIRVTELDPANEEAKSYIEMLKGIFDFYYKDLYNP